MKLLYIADRYRPLIGGGGNYVFNLATRMAGMGHEVTVYTSLIPNVPRREIKDRVVIQRFPPVLTVQGQPIMFFTKSLVTNHTDVIHISGPCLNEDFLLPTLHLIDKSIVMTYHADFITHNPLIRLYYSFKTTIPYSFVNKIIVTSEQYAALLCRRGLPERKVSVIPLGVDDAYFRPAVKGEKERLMEAYGLSGDIILFVGGLSRKHQYKHPEILLQAFKGLLKRRRQLTLVMVGGGEQVVDYHAYSTTLGISKNVLFTRLQPTRVVAELYRAADILVLPSPTLSEGFGTVLLEAMSSACPVVCTSACGGSQMVDDEAAGIVVPPWSPTTLMEAMDHLLSDKKKAKLLAENGRRAVEARYNLGLVVEKTLRVYQEVRR